MSQEIILKIGDTIEYAQGRRALLEKIRIISTGKFVEEYAYNGDGNDVVLALNDGQGIINFWVKDKPIHKIGKEKMEK